jgi:uncharacterized repeat protein (TIGR02543 family)
MRTRIWSIPLAVLTATFALGVGSAQAAPTETVTNLNDSGAGSLRQALANVDAGGTVTFNSSLSGAIDLQTALEVDKSFTLAGPGARKVTIDANNRDNILVIGKNTPGNYVVVVEGLTFFRGSARRTGTTRSAGGGISFTSGNSLTVRDSVFRQNLASGTQDRDDGEGGGGGIAVEGCTGTNDGASLTVESSYFVRNGAYSNGGGIGMFSKGALSITDSEFRNNVAEDGEGGGAVLVYPTRTVSSTCDFYSNSEQPSSAPFTVSDSLFEGNGSAPQAPGPVFSIQPGVGPKTIERSEFIRNGSGTFSSSSGSSAVFDSSASPMVVEDSLFEANGTREYGGAIRTRLDYDGPTFANMLLLDVKDSAFIGNSAGRSSDSAGALYYQARYNGLETGVEAELRIADSEFVDNSSVGGDGIGAVHMRGGANPFSDPPNPVAKPVLRVSGSRFVGNYGDYGTLQYSAASGSDTVAGEVEIRDSVFDSNVGGANGRTVYMNGGRANTVISNVAITRNTGGDQRGIGLELANGTSPQFTCETDTVRSQYELSNVTVAANAAGQNSRGVVRVFNCGSLDMEDSTVALNAILTSEGDTGGTAGLKVALDSTAVVRNSILADNSYGPAISGDQFDQTDCFVTDDSQLSFEGANLVGSLTGCEAATGTTPLTGNPGFAEFDPVEVQNLITRLRTFIVPLAADSRARGAALGGDWPETDQRGATRPGSAADLGAVQYYESFALEAERVGTGSGTVISDFAGIDCGEFCEETYPDGTTVTLTANPEPGSAFVGWSGDCTGTGSTCEVTMDEARTVTATFSVVGPPSEQGEIRIRKARPGPIKVGSNRTFAIAKVTCLVGTCQIKRVKTAQVRIGQKIYRAEATIPTGSFSAGETKTIKMKIPKVAFDSLKPRKSAIAAIYAVLVAAGSGDQSNEKVFRSVKVGLKR